MTTYADIATANYADSLITAQRLQTAVNTLLADPSAQALERAKAAWLAARVPYQQSEVFRFGNAIVDDWEGKVNAWPLDEVLIDYVDASYGGATDENGAAILNVVANSSFTLSGMVVDASIITPALLKETLQEADGIEANVAGAALIMGGVNGLIDQTRSIERVVAALGTSIAVEGSDSLDDPDAVFQ